MWLLAALFGLLLVVAGLEYLVFLVRRRRDRIVDDLIAIEASHRAMCEANTLICLYHVTNLLDAIYFDTSALGVEYDTHSRRVIAANVQIAREIIAQRTGPAPYIDWSHMPGNTWPFAKDGNVQP